MLEMQPQVSARKPKPLPFQPPMVRGLIREVEAPGTGKTQTRRILTRQPDPRCTEAFIGADGVWRFSRPTARFPVSHSDDDQIIRYAPGDILWVREAWRTEARYDTSPPRDVPLGALVSYEAGHDDEPNDGCRGRYRHGRFMPRWASRLTLEVTNVRVERLQDISEADAIAEGISQFCEDTDRPGSWTGLTGDGRATMVRVMYGSAARAYSHLWDTINGAGAWDANPWVVAVTFKVHRANVDGFLAARERAAA